MGTFRDDILADIDDIRAIPGEFGIRRFQVWVRVTEYDGSRIGDGAQTVTETRLLVGGQDPKVRQVVSKDLVAGTAELQQIEFDIGPLTPDFTAVDTIDPPRGAKPATTMYLVKGPGLPSSGLLCTRVYDSTDMALHYSIRVRGSGRRKPTP